MPNIRDTKYQDTGFDIKTARIFVESKIQTSFIPWLVHQAICHYLRQIGEAFVMNRI
jgi:hypothetical protein